MYYGNVKMTSFFTVHKGKIAWKYGKKNGNFAPTAHGTSQSSCRKSAFFCKRIIRPISRASSWGSY